MRKKIYIFKFIQFASIEYITNNILIEQIKNITTNARKHLVRSVKHG